MSKNFQNYIFTWDSCKCSNERDSHVYRIQFHRYKSMCHRYRNFVRKPWCQRCPRISTSVGWHWVQPHRLRSRTLLIYFYQHFHYYHVLFLLLHLHHCTTRKTMWRRRTIFRYSAWWWLQQFWINYDLRAGYAKFVAWILVSKTGYYLLFFLLYYLIKRICIEN